MAGTGGNFVLTNRADGGRSGSPRCHGPVLGGINENVGRREWQNCFSSKAPSPQHGKKQTLGGECPGKTIGWCTVTVAEADGITKTFWGRQDCTALAGRFAKRCGEMRSPFRNCPGRPGEETGNASTVKGGAPWRGPGATNE